MKKLFINLVVAMLMILTSCSGQKYLKKVKRNIMEFDLVKNHLHIKNEFNKNDSITLKHATDIKINGNICIYNESPVDSITGNFLKKYDLSRICFSRLNNAFFDSVITFHKVFQPFLGKAVIITYDFGKSRLRENVKKGMQPKNENVKIINDFYLYRVKSNPEFGE